MWHGVAQYVPQEKTVLSTLVLRTLLPQKQDDQSTVMECVEEQDKLEGCTEKSSEC